MLPPIHDVRPLQVNEATNFKWKLIITKSFWFIIGNLHQNCHLRKELHIEVDFGFSSSYEAIAIRAIKINICELLLSFMAIMMRLVLARWPSMRRKMASNSMLSLMQKSKVMSGQCGRCSRWIYVDICLVAFYMTTFRTSLNIGFERKMMKQATAKYFPFQCMFKVYTYEFQLPKDINNYKYLNIQSTHNIFVAGENTLPEGMFLSCAKIKFV